VRQAAKDRSIDNDPVLNARVDAVMATVGAAVGAIDSRFTGAVWRVILIDDFGHAAAAFPGGILIADSRFLRTLRLNDDELALIFSHEAAHVVAGHAAAKLSFMAEFLGKEKLPTARTALIEFLAKDSYAHAFRPAALLQEREADTIGAAIFFASGYDPQRALALFDKLAELERPEAGLTLDSHDPARVRKQAISVVLAELQRLYARRGPAPR
jgi:predicted Zn-dependent protease